MDVIFVFFQFLLLLLPSFSVVTFSVCLVFFLSVFVFLLYKRSGAKLSLLPTSLFAALVDSPGLHTDTKDRTLACSPRTRAHFTLFFPLNVYHRQWTGQSPDARTCSRTTMCPTTQQPSVHGNYTKRPQGNRRSQRTCVPALAFPNRSILLHPVLGCASNRVPTIPCLCAVYLLLPCMLMVLLIGTLPLLARTQTKLGILATTLYAVWTSAACALMF